MIEQTSLTINGGQLRAWHERDAAVLVSAWGDEQIAAWNPVPPNPDLATAAKWIAGVPDRAAGRVSLDWVIDIPAAGGLIGEVGLSGFSDTHHGAMIGYWLLPAGRGAGHATRAVAAVTLWAHTVLGIDTLVARCHPENRSSGAVVARVGYRNERADSSGHELWMSRTRGP